MEPEDRSRRLRCRLILRHAQRSFLCLFCHPRRGLRPPCSRRAGRTASLSAFSGPATPRAIRVATDSGESRDGAVLTYDDSAGSLDASGEPVGTSGSATLTV